MKNGLLQDLRKWRFWRHFGVHFFAAIGLVASVLALFDAILPDRLSEHPGSISLAVLILAGAYALYRAWPRPIRQRYTTPNTEICIIFADLFDRSTDLVIGFCDTFDTAIPDIIAASSIQGQFMEKIYGNGIAKLDLDLKDALAQAACFETIDKAGKTDRYAMGTVAVLRENTRRFYCLAYTSMDADNVAHGSTDSIWRSLDSLWTAVAKHSNGNAVAMPVIGGGLARISNIVPAQDAIRLMILSFMFASRGGRICERLDIVIRPGDEKHFDRLELQAFLRSLRSS